MFLSYVLSFVYVAIYWNNHHQLFLLVPDVDGAVLWTDNNLLFWLSLIPFTTSWLGEHPAAPVPAALYGFSLLMPALAWPLLQFAIIRAQGGASKLRAALGADRKGKVSPLLYLLGMALAFVDTRLADIAYVLMAGMWSIPDRRITRAIRD